MGIEMAEMKFRVNAVWNKKSGFKDYTKQEAGVDSKKQKSKEVETSKEIEEGSKGYGCRDGRRA